MTRVRPSTVGVAPEAVRSPTAWRSALPAKVLIADADVRSLLAAGEALRTEGLDVTLAASDATALRHMLREEFAAFLLAAPTFRIDDCELAALIRGRERSARVPIIFLTDGDDDPSPTWMRSGFGTVDRVAKPINPHVLRAKVGSLVELHLHGAPSRCSTREQRPVEGTDGLSGRIEEPSPVRGCWSVASYTASIATSPRRLRFLNDSVRRMTGFRARDFSARSDLWEANLHPDDAERALVALDRIVETGGASLEYRFRGADGTERRILDQCSLERDSDGEPVEVVGLWMDVTEQRLREANLLHASRLEAIGRLTGSITHDVNNMLAVAIGSLELLQTCIGEAEARDRAQTAIDAAQSCADLTRRLQALSRPRSPETGATDLRAVVPATVEMLKPMLGERVDVRLDIPEDIRPVSVERSKLEAALVSLVASSREAMPAGGRLDIAVLDAVDPAATGRGRYVEIAISDTRRDGSAADLDPDPHHRFMEKSANAAPGLRLVLDLLKKSGGDVRIERSPEGGQTIRLLLPS